MRAKLLLILGVWAFFCLPAPVRAADSSAVVCGVAIDQENPFSWGSFKSQIEGWGRAQRRRGGKQAQREPQH